MCLTKIAVEIDRAGPLKVHEKLFGDRTSLSFFLKSLTGRNTTCSCSSKEEERTSTAGKQPSLHQFAPVKPELGPYM